ncbi:MFS transporter [Mycobacterium cookii]|uniref:Permease n=1 Tax=Mycobacterium cookii TaxID=1775 RepID=A0A7I7L0K4_9MYCO|nr:MFS transporter [Mycobacterium cookii]MCV7330489.1 MFS transporter [Mycobacterium cookii]BBX47321.1 permease [Mycobacterium cookii]
MNRPTSLLREPQPASAAPRVNVEFGAVLAVLLATGWVANHFVALMPAISDRQHLSTATLDAIFGIYAVGLLPGLLLGGRASDALGRRAVALTGSATAAAGTVAMLLSQQPDVLTVGRLTVGIGVGLTMSSGTAWASDLKGPAGAATAGAVLIVGFAVGPFAGGLITGAGEPGVQMSFAVAAVLVLAAMTVAVLATRRSPTAVADESRGPAQETASRQGITRALSWALPLAPWVFASATLGFVTIPARVHTGLAAPVAAGLAALTVNGASGVIQIIARAANWGPRAGTTGAVLAALSYALIAVAPPTMTLAMSLPLLLILGCASGLSLREGLIDLEAAAPQHVRGTLTGVFYSVTYIGFGLPLLLTTGGSDVTMLVLGIMAILASVAAVSRTMRLRRDSHRQN